MPRTKGKPLLDIEIGDEVGDDIREMQIAQTVNGLNLMPQMRGLIQQLADDDDEIAKEVLKRYDAQ